MAANATIRVEGVKEALKELNTINKRLRREITKDFRQIVQPVVNDSVDLLPFKEPMSGWQRGWNPLPGRQSVTGDNKRDILPWDDRAFYAKQIRAYTSGKKPRAYNGFMKNAVAFGIRWTGPQATLFDMTQGGKTEQGRRMARVLNERYGPASRIIWRAYERSSPDVERQMRQLINRVMMAVGRNLRV